MLTDDIMDVGCTAFYRLQHMGEHPKSISRGFARAFRNGVAFGTRLKLAKITPHNLLELGAGDGYFARGIKFVFPEVKITCLDLVDEVLKHIRTHHGFETIKGSPESLNLKAVAKFDFIVARDVIEHLSNASGALTKIKDLLVPGGYLHFVVPNGNEDYWGLFCNWRLYRRSSEMLLNHVNFFDPKGMESKLNQLDLKPVFWFTYDFKGTRQGYGHRISPKLSSGESIKRSAQKTIEDNKSLNVSFETVDSIKVLALWWLKLPRWCAMLYCFFKHYPFLKLHANRGIGHEIFCIARKS